MTYNFAMYWVSKVLVHANDEAAGDEEAGGELVELDRDDDADVGDEDDGDDGDDDGDDDGNNDNEDDNDNLRGSTLNPSAKETRPWGKLCMESQLITCESSSLSL